MKPQNSVTISLDSESETTKLLLSDAIIRLEKAMQQRNVKLTIHLATQLIEQAPKNLCAYTALCQIYQHLNQYVELKVIAKKLIKEHPLEATGHYHLSCAYRFLRQAKQATRTMETAVSLSSDIEWRNQLGIMYKENADFSLALNCFDKCIELDKNFSLAYWQRSDIQPKMKPESVAILQQLIADNTIQTNEVNARKTYACYALYRHFDAKESYQTAFNYLSLGAKIKRSLLKYDHAAEIKEHIDIAKVYNKAFFYSESSKTNSDLGEHPDAKSPIFICGLPRSGTTLAEQIVSSHTQVAAGDELFELAQATQDTLKVVQPSQSFPFWASEFNNKDWQRIGDNYLRLTKHINKSQHFTDKMPLNYKAIGLIVKSLPQAKIIHCYRPPMDLLLGCYQQLLGQGNKYSYDLDELSDMIIAHHHLMEHWKRLLPDKIYTLNYQHMINHQKDTTKELLEFLALEWQDSCLTFHNNKRVVHTLSNAQVRKPLFKTSLNAWHKYRSQLEPYAIKMADAGLEL